MARIFSIYFTYNGAMHHAIISVRQTPFFTEYTLNNMETDLLSQLPGNKIISTSSGHYVFQNAGNTSNQLMQTIITAVSEHLQATEA